MAAASVIVGLLAVAGCGGGSDAGDGGGTRSSPAPAPELRASTDVRQPPARVDAGAGEVAVEAGPFTDRVELTRLALDGGPPPVVGGRVRNSVDVSELIVLELQADFYDRRGRYLGSGRQVFEDAHAGAGEPPLRFAIAPDDPTIDASSALLSIPQLVNE